MALQLAIDPREQIERLAASAHRDVDTAQTFYARSIFADELQQTAPVADDALEHFERVLFGLETVGLDLHDRYLAGSLAEEAGCPWRDLLWPAYRLRRALSLLSSRSRCQSEVLDDVFEEALDGVLANRQPELRLHLSKMDLSRGAGESARWDQYLEAELKRAFLLSIRKAGGLEDLEQAAAVIDQMRDQQHGREPSVEQITNPLERQLAALRTLALYNCAKAIELMNDYVRGATAGGRQRLTDRGVKAELDRFIFNAREVLSGVDPALRVDVGRLGRACHALVDASVFSPTLPPGVRKFIDALAAREDKPILELWYAQRQAIDLRLLDPTRAAVVISMPTSAGKTLLAECAIVQANSDNPSSRIVYLAPTRALVTQASLTLRKDLQDCDITVRVATPSFELSPVEDEILAGGYDVLVTTPEKLDLLVRDGHPSVTDLSLVVVDEAHNLADRERGARLELLLSTLRRERVGCRFLLLTPFARNAGDLARWLGSQAGVPVVIDWKPNDRIVGCFQTGRKSGPHRPLLFRTIESAHSDFPGDVFLGAGVVSADTKGSKERLAVAGTLKWARAKKGGVLLLASSRAKAVERARTVAHDLGLEQQSSYVDLVCRFLNTEVGGEHPLSAILKQSVAFHHAGLSPEARYFVERLVEQGLVKVLCATTTLAQGVHFPLSAAVIESFRRSRKLHGRWISEEIQPWEFWNIAGRVGRTLEDPLGSIAFAASTPKDISDVRQFLARDAGTVVSSLVSTLEALHGQDVSFDIRLLRDHRALSAFLQYLLHAVAVAGKNQTEAETEGLLRGSLAFAEAQKRGQGLAEELIRWARRYLDGIAQQKGNALSGFAKMADGTGFSSPSIDLLWAQWRDTAAPETWHATSLFPATGGASEILTGVMQALGSVPEVRLGSHEAGTFNPARIARIATAWVNGESLITIAQREYNGDLLGCTRHIYSAISTLVPWGLRAIQRVAFAGREGVDWGELELLPAMVMHGVRSTEAIGLRILNVPRIAAEGLASVAHQQGLSPSQLADWLRESQPALWHGALPSDSLISGQECKRLWEVLDGQLPWERVVQPSP